MRLRITNLGEEPYSTDFESADGEMLRILVPPGESTEVENIDPYYLNQDEILRAEVQPGRLAVMFLADADDLVALASAFDENAHAATRQLVHLADFGGGPYEGFSGAVRQTLPAGDPFPTSVVWWTDGTMTRRIVDLTITRNAEQLPTQEQWRVYDAAGALVRTATDVILYSGPFETDRFRTVA